MTETTSTPFERAMFWADRRAWLIFVVVGSGLFLYAYMDPNTPLGRWRTAPVRNAIAKLNNEILAPITAQTSWKNKFTNIAEQLRAADISDCPGDFREAWVQLTQTTLRLVTFDDGTLGSYNVSPEQKARLEEWLRAVEKVRAVGARYAPTVK